MGRSRFLTAPSPSSRNRASRVYARRRPAACTIHPVAGRLPPWSPGAQLLRPAALDWPGVSDPLPHRRGPGLFGPGLPVRRHLGAGGGTIPACTTPDRRKTWLACAPAPGQTLGDFLDARGFLRASLRCPDRLRSTCERRPSGFPRPHLPVLAAHPGHRTTRRRTAARRVPGTRHARPGAHRAGRLDTRATATGRAAARSPAGTRRRPARARPAAPGSPAARPRSAADGCAGWPGSAGALAGHGPLAADLPPT